MHSRSRLLFMVLLLVVGTLALPWAASAQEPVTSRLKLSIGGYIKPEFIYRTNSGGIGTAGVPFGANNFGFAVIAQPNTTAHDNGMFTGSAAETRFNFTLTAPDWRGLKPTAFLEMDFAGNNPGVVDAYCPGPNTTGAGAQGQICAVPQNAGSPDTGSLNPGGFRIRHAFFRLAGEGLGGSWEMTFGQTWGIFGMLPYYSGSSLSFGGATIFGQRQPQLSLRHNWRFLRDFTWQTAIGAVNDTTRLNESPAGEISGRLIYTGWQGWQGGARSPLNLGISSRIQRQKADVEALAFPSAIPNSAAGPGNKSLSATAWGITGGLFLPILPGTSATDRTWALSGVMEGGYGEGVNTLIPGTNPLPGAVVVGSNNRADPGGVYFHPGKCSGWAGPTPPSFSVPVAINCGGGTPVGQQTNLSLIQSRWLSYNVQFYLPWNFWLSGGQKWIWYTNSQNAAFATCVTSANGACLFTVIPIQQGRSVDGPLPGFVNGAQITNNDSLLFGGKDSVIKRQSYTYVALFYDMTPNIRWGFEWGMNTTDRRDSAQDGAGHRWQLGAYYFF